MPQANKQPQKRQRTTPKKLAALKRYAQYLEKKIAQACAIGATEKRDAYLALLWDFLKENPQLKKKYPALGNIIEQIDKKTTSSDHYLCIWQKNRL